MRDFNLVLSPRFERLTQTVEGTVINSYYLPEDSDGGERALRWVVDSFTFFSQRFAPYPFAEFDVVATPTTAGGIEYPGLIVMPISGYDEEGGFFQLATIHEVAHQWWYSLVGNDQQDEPWLDEALTQYSTALFYEVNEGWEEAGEEMFAPWYEGIKGTEWDGPIDLPVSEYEEITYGPLVYGKGPLFFHVLRQEVGDEAFFAILQVYFDTYRYQIASGPDFLAVAEQVSGQDLSALFQEWLPNTQ
jgi:aminopeptidase N